MHHGQPCCSSLNPLEPVRAVWLLAAALTAAPCLADDASPAVDHMWRVELDGLFFSTFGTDRVTGGVGVRDASSTPVTETYAPIQLKIDADGTGRFELTRFNARWGWGLSGWWYDGGDSDTRIEGLTSDSANGITRTLFTEALVPSLVAPDVGTGFVSYGGTTHISTGVFQVYGAYPVGAAKAIEVRFGLRLAKMREGRNENAGRVAGAAFELYTLDGEANTHVLAGPTVGLRAQGRVGRSSYEGWADLAVVFGDVDYRMISEGMQDGQTPVRSLLRDRGHAVIPSIEIGARWKYAIAPRWGLGATVFSSIWLDAPTAPLPASSGLTDPAVPARGAVFNVDTFSGAGFGLAVSWTDRPR